MSEGVIRVVVWSTGGIGSIAVRAVAENPGTDLVGVWVHSPDKAGRDAGEIVGIGPIGVTATNDADALIALRPDCVVYAANGPERDAAAVPDYVRLLEAGINVVTTKRQPADLPGRRSSPTAGETVDDAAAAGGCVTVRQWHRTRFRRRPSGADAGHPVEDDHQDPGQRDRALRRLPGGRHDDGRDGFRAAARLHPVCWPTRARSPSSGARACG